MKISRGDVFYVDLGKGVGSEQENERPCVVIQNNVGNTYSPTTIIACLTTQFTKKKMPTHVQINRTDALEHSNRFVESLVLLEQIRTVDKTRLKDKIAVLKPETMKRIDKALSISIFDFKK